MFVGVAPRNLSQPAEVARRRRPHDNYTSNSPHCFRSPVFVVVFVVNPVVWWFNGSTTSDRRLLIFSKCHPRPRNVVKMVPFSGVYNVCTIIIIIINITNPLPHCVVDINH